MTVESTDKSKQIGLLISYYITLSFWSAQTLSLSMISRNIAGQTKKATVVATNFVAWAVGNSIGKSPTLKICLNPLLTKITRSAGIFKVERTALPHRLHRASRLL